MSTRPSRQQRLHIQLSGAVQGVGFRPFVFRLAQERGLAGWVANGMRGVEVDVEGTQAELESFLLALSRDTPRLARLSSIEPRWLPPTGHREFSIRVSSDAGPANTLVLPDVACCADCLADIRDPDNRRFRYPFTNCTNCGPRYSLLQSLPYDRANTSMSVFPMCPDCEREFHDPEDRRFHAQPNACPVCGPQLEWRAGDCQIGGEAAISAAAESLRRGEILALKGLGGFQLLVDALNEEAVARLRDRKQRETKPFAVMVDTVHSAGELCRVLPLEERLLSSPEAPIVLLKKRSAQLAASVAPGNPTLGLMLPTTPLHHILLSEFQGPVVATSGNRSEEPICIDNDEALERLGDVADTFLLHDRAILRPVDDSVARVIVGREQLLRRARGYAPLPVRSPKPADGILALGGHMKCTIALGVGSEIFVSQHIGDLADPLTRDLHASTIRDLASLCDREPRHVACDLHPDYASTIAAEKSGLPLTRCQHHEAHVAACLAEHGMAGPCIAFSWDGTGYGRDRSIWGGEVFDVDSALQFQRILHLRSFPLPGGERAAREGWRCAAGLLYEAYGAEAFTMPAFRALVPDAQRVGQALEGRINSPRCSSIGRLFDAIAALTGICSQSEHEGEAAARLEFAAGCVPDAEPYPGADLDWQPLLDGILQDLDANRSPNLIAARFHRSLVHAALRIARSSGRTSVVLTGGCFQNALLTEMLYAALVDEQFEVLIPQRVPPNDGGLALGQAFLATIDAHDHVPGHPR